MMIFGWIDLAADALHLSRLRGRSARSAGWGLSPLGQCRPRRHPHPSKRERERTFFVVAIKPNFIML